MGRSIFVFFLFSAITLPAAAPAASIGELKTQIEERQSEISKLDQLIAEQEKALAETGKQANTLRNVLKTAELTVRKLNNEIKRTETEIRAATLKLEGLNGDILDTTGGIEEHEQTLRELMRQVARMDRESLPVMLASYRRLSDFWADEDRLDNLQQEIYQSTMELRALRLDLGEQVSETEAARSELLGLKQELADQQKIAAAERTRQSNLLAQTKNQEANYKKLLEETRERREAFARELGEFEAQLRLEIDPDLVPEAGKGILAWPLNNIFVTQQFGKTADAKRLYASGAHNGTDFRASIGTPVTAAAAGAVAGVGDTDLVCRGASYGRWVLIKHDNGLATLSAHLSLIKAAPGERVARGQLIGYSGVTGYATGPHLHFTVAAAQGVEIRSFKSKVCPGTYVMPIFDTRAYLDPLLYLGG